MFMLVLFFRSAENPLPVNGLTCFEDAYKGRTVLVTGHTGFKGSWLSFWLAALGAKVIGVSLPPPSQPNHWELLPRDNIISISGDIRIERILDPVMETHRPEVVFHLAAQPLVRRSYQEPVETFATNVLGTVNVLESCRQSHSIQAVICVTSDKVYENRESPIGYTETAVLGGFDPYSNSKACAELVARCYREALFQKSSRPIQLATVRAGNVIGGGDWAQDRLIPDAIRAASVGQSLEIRNPHAIRPWQHVLDPLTGYLMIGKELLAGNEQFASAWNFGPEVDGNVSVRTVIETATATWPKIHAETLTGHSGPHETTILKLDSAKARLELGWQPVWPWKEAIQRTVTWYRDYYEAKKLSTGDDLRQFIRDASEKKCSWVRA